METYIIKVNGYTYEVEVEKKGAGSSSASAAPAAQSVPAAPAPVQAAQATATPAAGGQAGEPVETGTAGKIWKIVQKAGAEVKRGDSIVILEAMKMEIPVVAPRDGKVGEILVAEGDAVESGQAVATLL